MMLNHACVAVRSARAAKEVFELLFGFHPLYSFHIESEIITALFGISGSADAIVYDASNTRIEVFIIAGVSRYANRFDHLCFCLKNRDEIISRASEIGYEIRRYQRQDALVVFIVDNDGNLYEVKEESTS